MTIFEIFIETVKAFLDVLFVGLKFGNDLTNLFYKCIAAFIGISPILVSVLISVISFAKKMISK